MSSWSIFFSKIPASSSTSPRCPGVAGSPLGGLRIFQLSLRYQTTFRTKTSWGSRSNNIRH
uniref:Uncharacterized protein n=1 Tax=Anguilla anguilla TaxID=7936 RepID=A0A0E9TM42_ANGAN